MLEFCSLGVIKPQIQASEFSYTNLSPISQMRKPRLVTNGNLSEMGTTEEMHLTLRAGEWRERWSRQAGQHLSTSQGFPQAEVVKVMMFFINI